MLASYPVLTEYEVRAFAPGRVNLIGEHTDYNDGLALPFAITRGITVSASTSPEPFVEVDAPDIQRHDRFPLSSPGRTGGWQAFVRGTVAELLALGVALPGATVRITGDLPRGSGLSSSAALTAALSLALLGLAGVGDMDRIEVARLGQRVENNWVGAQTGLLDQLASLCCTENNALLIDFRTLDLEPLPMVLGEHRLLVLDSGEHHGNATSGYNQRRQECTEAAHRMGKESLRDAQIQDLHLLPDTLERRARHVISENGRVLQAATAIRTGDVERLGRLLDASHASLRDDYEVSTDAIEDTVVRLKRAGAIGARLIGGGFGGSVLALMPPGAEPPPEAIPVSPGPGARLL